MEINIKVCNVEEARTAIELLLAYIKMQSPPEVPGEPISVLYEHGLTVRSRNALVAEGIATMPELLPLTEWQLRRIVNMGKSGVKNVLAAVASYCDETEKA